MSTPTNQPEKKVKRSRCRTCREFGVKAKNPQTGYKKLYAAIKIGGQVQADLSKPHVCQGAPIDEEKVRRVVVAELDRRGVAKLDPFGNIPSPIGTPIPKPEVASSDMRTHADTTRPVTPSITMEQMVTAINNAVAARMKPIVERIIIVKKDNGEEVEIKEHTHPLFARLLRYVRSGSNVYLFGAPGGGKSHATAQVARALGRQYGYISLAPMTPESRVMGFVNATGQFVDTSFYNCYTKGGVFCIDEMDNANDAMLTALNGALENNRAAFPNGVFDRHADFVMVGTGNTAGYGGTRGHAGRRAFDAATRERFAYIEWVYDEEFERKLALAANPVSGAWIDWVQSVRATCRDRKSVV